MDGIQIRRWNDSDDPTSLTELLHRAYACRAEEGLFFTATRQSVETTIHRLSMGSAFVMELDDHIVGTVSVWQADPDSKSDPEFYRQPGVAVLSQFGIEPGLQGRGLGKLLLEVCEGESRQRGCHWLALDTAEPAASLIKMYERWGFSFVHHHDWGSGVNYRSVVMAKPV